MSRLTKVDLEQLNLCYERGLDISRRIIYIFDDIDSNMAEHVIKGLQFLSLSPAPIYIMICSQGGSVTDMFAMYDAIRSCENEIITIGIGEVCSAAGLLLLAGDKRLASRNCLFMAHQVSGGYNEGEDLSVVKAQIAATEVCWKKWAKCMALHSNHSEAYWLKEVPDKKRELWLTTEDMLKEEHGMLDGVWE